MLAELLDVSVRTIRRWHRAGLVQATAEKMQVPYFDFATLTSARQLANWMACGMSVSAIQVQLDALSTRLGGTAISAEFAEWPISVEGGRLVLRDGDNLLESSGQLRFGFDSETNSIEEPPRTLSFEAADRAKRLGLSVVSEASFRDTEGMTIDEVVEQAIAAEDEDDFDTAIRWYRCALTSHGLNADVCFQLAELLYRTGDIGGARERYFNALEIDPDLVEARANLGCVLVECGQLDLAIASFEGALEQFPEYADVHFHLARALDDNGESGRAAEHWQEFLTLAPSSPWADEARERLSEHIPLEFPRE